MAWKFKSKKVEKPDNNIANPGVINLFPPPELINDAAERMNSHQGCDIMSFKKGVAYAIGYINEVLKSTVDSGDSFEVVSGNIVTKIYRNINKYADLALGRHATYFQEVSPLIKERSEIAKKIIKLGVDSHESKELFGQIDKINCQLADIMAL